MKTYTIRPLEWNQYGPRHYHAFTAIADYTVYHASGEQWTWYQADMRYDSLEAAKAACQADFEERLAKWLVEDTRLQAIREVVKEQTP